MLSRMFLERGRLCWKLEIREIKTGRFSNTHQFAIKTTGVAIELVVETTTPEERTKYSES